MDLLGERYRIVSSYEEGFSTDRTGLPINTYKCYDELGDRNVIIKSIKLPENQQLTDLAIGIWEQDIRFSRKALSMENGKFLLKLIDARLDKNRKELLTVFEYFEENLSSMLNQKPDIRMFHKELNIRKQFWMNMLSIVKAIDALHQSGIFIRNLSPKNIFLTENDERPFVLGDFSWSIYIHSLTQLYLKNKLTLPSQITDLFLAPERSPGNTLMRTGENFSSDLYSFGMILVNCLTDAGFKNIPGSFEERLEMINEIKNNLKINNNFFFEEERSLILKLIEVDPQSRMNTASKVLEEINNILSLFIEEDEFTILHKLPISFDERPGSLFLKDLEYQIDLNIDDIRQNIDGFLEKELKGAFLYVSDNKNFPLCTLSNNNICYEFSPPFSSTYQKENLTVARLKIPNKKFQEKFLKLINSSIPIAKLQEGVYFSNKPYSTHAPGWTKLFSNARTLINERSNQYDNEINNFIERLFLILDAQKHLDSKQIFSYQLKSQNKDKDVKEEKITVKLFSEENFYIKKSDISSFVHDTREKSQGIVELSKEDSPYASFDKTRSWEISSFNKDTNELALIRRISNNNKGVLQKGYIRPNELSLGVDLHNRKRFGIIDTKDNNSLLDILLYPRNSLFNLGLPEKYSEPILDRILGTIPMFLTQGPPGTGKTWLASSVLEKIILEESTSRILLSCHDHEPLDNLLEAVHEKLQKNSFSYIDYPIIVRMLSSDREEKYNQDAIARQYSQHQVTKKILLETKNKIINSNSLNPDLKNMWLDELEKNLENPSFDWIDLIKKSANIVFSTATGNHLRFLERNAPPFDWVIIEEAGKAYITELLLPMNLGQRWLLIGDQKQLPPYMYREMNDILLKLIEESTKLKDLAETDNSDFKERLISETKFFDDLYRRFQQSKILYSDNEHVYACERLQKQWRMPPIISDMISTIFYDNTLFDCQKGRTRNGDPFISPEFLFENELIWINTPHCINVRETEEKSLKNGGYENIYEVKVIGKLLESIKLNNEISNFDISILSPYKDQVQLLGNSLKDINSSIPNIHKQCYTVDSYQGRQADVVIVSMVRNNDKEYFRSALGFITEEERLNVLLSRSKKRLVIIGCIDHFETFNEESEVKKLAKIIEYIKKKGKIIESSEIMSR